MNRSAHFLTVLLLAVAAHGQINNLQGNSLNINTPSFPNIPNISIPTPSFPSFGNTAAPACAANCGWNTIDVNGASTLNVNPDIATLNVQVTGNGRTTTDAINNLSQKINNVLTTLTNIGLNSNNWQTTSLNVYPNSSFVNGRQIVYGQIAQQSMTVSIPMPNSNGSTVGRIYDGLAQISDIAINSLTFDLQDKTSSYTQARRLAYQDAVKRATDYTNAAGVTLQAPLTVTDSFSTAPVVTPLARETLVASAMRVAVPTTVSVGTIAINYNVAVTFSFA